MNAGLTLRTAHIRGGLASVRTGATLLFDSDPAAEERETRLKARALLEVLAETDAGSARAAQDNGAQQNRSPYSPGATLAGPGAALPGPGLRGTPAAPQDAF